MSDDQPRPESRMFQIYEDDLAELERLCPVIADAAFFSAAPRDDARLRTQVTRVKNILSHVRWNYGPPSQVTVIPADDPPLE